MSTDDTRTSDGKETPNPAGVDMKLEVVVIPVSDIDRAKEFYESLGWRLDADKTSGDEFRLVQLTPKGSGCSIQFGTGLTPSQPGSAQALHLIVSDIEVARTDLLLRGVDASEVFHCASGYACRFPGNDAQVPGPHPEHVTYGSFLYFTDPDGNGWILQEVTARLPGRGSGGTTMYTSAPDMSQALQRAAAVHSQYGPATGTTDPKWADLRQSSSLGEHTQVPADAAAQDGCGGDR
jgi:catechol 2,3-dioxygenase-like lactoylglutathione lyase family enzyme